MDYGNAADAEEHWKVGGLCEDGSMGEDDMDGISGVGERAGYPNEIGVCQDTASGRRYYFAGHSVYGLGDRLHDGMDPGSFLAPSVETDEWNRRGRWNHIALYRLAV